MHRLAPRVPPRRRVASPGPPGRAELALTAHRTGVRASKAPRRTAKADLADAPADRGPKQVPHR